MNQFNTIFVDTCTSTNDLAKKHQAYDVIYAGRQTKGKGRLGRTWIDGNGNLMASVVLPYKENAQHYSFLISLAIAQTLSFLSPRIKWPNDILIDGKKICGILLEAVDDKLIIGFGINILSHPTDGLLYQTTDLQEQGYPVNVKKLLDDILQNLSFVIDLYEKTGFKQIRLDWLQFAMGLGQGVIVNLPCEKLKGTFDNIDENGTMIVLDENGKKHLITAGDVFLI
jgi:BirA family biotin operon repressor/biotin-[acetyl-CoA-carboxylase] ligase